MIFEKAWAKLHGSFHAIEGTDHAALLLEMHH
jgi:hypothetical protein